jgi:hypothetical protein
MSKSGPCVLITESYRQLNQQLHESNPAYGVSGQKYAQIVRALMDQLGTSDVLDYGAGKCTLQRALGQPITNFDPCVPGLDTPPRRPFDIVACTDVLEHIEPDCVDAVLADLRRVTHKVCFMVIHTGPAKKFLADGRNAHLIQEGEDWWRPRIVAAGFVVRPEQWTLLGKEIFTAVTPQEPS